MAGDKLEDDHYPMCLKSCALFRDIPSLYMCPIMSQVVKDQQLQECYRIISGVARDASSKGATEVPAVLLRLKQVLVSKTLSVKQLTKVKEYIWLNDLLHVNVETLRQDFTKIRGQWATAAGLASILATICSGLHPRATGHGGQSQTEQRAEFYDILLPTSTDSLLILANNLLEMEQRLVDSGFQSSEIKHFECILNSILEVCRSHRQCIERVLQSPYLLHLLITDLIHHCSVVLSFLSELVVIDTSLLFSLPPDILHGLLDELVFKLSGEHERVAILSLELMATFAVVNHTIVDLISSRYSGVLDLAVKWSHKKRNSVNVVNFISHLKTQIEAEIRGSVQHRAAAAIQAAWRGHATRRKLKKMQQGIRRFQEMYRRKKAKKLKQEQENRATKSLHVSKELNLKSQRLNFREKQLAVMEQLPASEINRFVTQQESEAAIAIQSWWKGRLARAKCDKLRVEARESESAVVIQRAFRQYKKRKSSREESIHHLLLHQIKGAEREALQGEIAQYQEQNPFSYKSENEARELHDRVQSLTEQFYLSRVEQHRKDTQRAELLSQLNESCEMLLRAPNLRDSFTMPHNDIAMAFAASGSAAVSKMAQMAHREELRTLNTPWWKRQTVDNDELFALL